MSVESPHRRIHRSPVLLEQILGWREALNLGRPREMFERMLNRVKRLAVGIAQGGQRGEDLTGKPHLYDVMGIRAYSVERLELP